MLKADEHYMGAVSKSPLLAECLLRASGSHLDSERLLARYPPSPPRARTSTIHAASGTVALDLSTRETGCAACAHGAVVVRPASAGWAC